MKFIEDVLWALEARTSRMSGEGCTWLSGCGCLLLIAIVVGGAWYLTSKGIMTWTW